MLPLPGDAEAFMLIGYARTSPLEQGAGLEAQVRDLKALGCERVYQEHTSSVGRRAELEAALDFVRAGDVLVVTKMDRLAHSVQHMWKIAERLQARGVALKIVNLGVDTSTPTGKLMMTMLGGVVEFERDMMLERQREGFAKAKAEGKQIGRPSSIPTEEIQELAAQGLSMRRIAQQLGIGKGSVHRVLKPQ
jgi:DNA invertase Pin-like site-specific DNA recombinase